MRPFFNGLLGGSKQDGKVLPERRYTNDWDGPWIGATTELDDGWSGEIFFRADAVSPTVYHVIPA